MPRHSQLIYPQREPAPLRPAATVLLLRDGSEGLQVLMTRRSQQASFAPGAAKAAWIERLDAFFESLRS